jgi:hypothetical protein
MPSMPFVVNVPTGSLKTLVDFWKRGLEDTRLLASNQIDIKIDGATAKAHDIFRMPKRRWALILKGAQG